jgi:hypothetical protein
MFLIRDIMYCKPGQARPMVEKFVALSKALDRHGVATMRVMTDFCAERYWTVVAQTEVSDLQAFERMQQAEGMKEMDEAMKGYHDLVLQGRREIYRLEG